jgi:hypothetical protein
MGKTTVPNDTLNAIIAKVRTGFPWVKFIGVEYRTGTGRAVVTFSDRVLRLKKSDLGNYPIWRAIGTGKSTLVRSFLIEYSFEPFKIEL